jgi:hypothetical protein
MTVRSWFVCAAVLSLSSSLLFSSACGGKSPATPIDPTPTPVPTDPATPVPSPAGTALPGTTCNLPPSGQSHSCSREGTDGVFRHDVDTAIHQLMAEQPQIFSGMHIKDRGAYRVGVTRNLEAMGYCAMWDGPDVGIKKDNNEISEHYHIDISNGTVNRGSAAYILRCHPAAFPINPAPLPQRGDCILPTSTSYGCARLEESGTRFVQVMDAAADEVARTRTDLVVNGVLKSKQDDYLHAIIDILTRQGFCAFRDSDNINLKLISDNNSFSEWYHPVLSSGKVWLGYAAYRGTCRPAVF